MLTDFEAYLLGKMRAVGLVAAALRTADVSPEECVKQARRAADNWGLDQSIHSADVYRQAIGEPISERRLTGDDTPPVFVGSVCRLYRLPLWPRVLFRVNQHPTGYAWGVAFVQDLSVRSSLQPSTVEPWEWVSGAIESAASELEILDHWDHQKDVQVVFDRDGRRLRYNAKFDFDLLQEWSQATG